MNSCLVTLLSRQTTPVSDLSALRATDYQLYKISHTTTRHPLVTLQNLALCRGATKHDEQQRSRSLGVGHQGVPRAGNCHPVPSSSIFLAKSSQLETVISTLEGDPSNAGLLDLKKELEEGLSILESALADLRPTQQPHKQNQQPAPPVEEKWSKEKHPAFQPGYKRPGAVPSPVEETPQAPVAFKVNDTVLAKWISGDKAFYPARITAITGSSAAPVYNVTFKSYDNSETLRAHDIKPISNDFRKRKADESAAAGSSSPAPSSHHSGVISAAANINPDLATQARKEPSLVSDGPTRPAKVARKVKANKELEAGKSKWQDFTSKGKFGKTVKKDSMFRTGESINARGMLWDCLVLKYHTNCISVGFVGSGQSMRKDPTRTRHIYQPGEEDAT